MNVIICIDDKNGMDFNHRRQSSDKEQQRDMLTLIGDGVVHMSPYTAKLFASSQPDTIRISDCPHMDCGNGEYCFIEEVNPAIFEEEIETLIIYRWNKVYPADLFCTLDLSESSPWKRIEAKDFVGNSHEQITREIYSKGPDR